MMKQWFLTAAEKFNKKNFLVVHRSLLEKSELLDSSMISPAEHSGDFFFFTYHQIFDATEKLAGGIQSEGNSTQKFIPIVTSNPFDLILWTISLWRINAIPVPLNYHLLKNELREQINYLNAENVFCETKLADAVPSLKRFSSSSTYFKNEALPTGFNLLNIAVLMFTSGTSGKPKAVSLSYHNLFAAYKSGNSIFNYTKNDSWYLNLPLYHIGGFSILVRAILSGSSLIIPESNDCDSLKNNLNITKPTFVSLVPTQLKRICENEIIPNNELRAALIGGGFSDITLISNAVNLGWKIYKVYGSTETSAFITVLTPDDLALKPKSVGKPLSRVEINIFDEKRNILPVNAVGEIGIKAPSISNGYLNKDNDSNSKFSNGFFLTGDFGSFDADGYLYLENRRTDLIVSGGENISPIEIENAISQFPGIDEVCVFGLLDKEWGEIVTAGITTIDKREINFSELQIFLKDKLPSFKRPKKYFQLKEFPKSAIGKIKRSEVKRLFNRSSSQT